jgi:hypothetical protein
MNAQPTPSEVARSFFAAVEAHQWGAASAMLEPTSAAEVRDRALAVLIGWARQRKMVSASGERPGMMGFTVERTPDSTALAEVSGTALGLFADLPTLDALAALSPIEFAARYLELSQRSLSAEDRPTAEFRRVRYDVIGHVIEGDTLAHVLYRPSESDVTTDDPLAVGALRLHRVGPDWRVRMPRELLELPLLLLVEQSSRPRPR